MSEKFTTDAKGRQIIDKDPNATLDYSFDWTAWLDGVTDGIASATVTATGGVTVDSVSTVGKSVTAWVSGGAAGDTASLTCRITTDNVPARIDERTVYLKIRER